MYLAPFAFFMRVHWVLWQRFNYRTCNCKAVPYRIWLYILHGFYYTFLRIENAEWSPFSSVESRLALLRLYALK